MHVAKWDHVSFGGLQPMHQLILDRVWVDISVEYGPMYRPILVSVNILGGFTRTSLILYRCFTDTLPSPSVLVDIIYRLIHWSTLDRHSTGQ